MEYKTKQSELILNTLKEHEGVSFSATKLNEMLKENVSTATLYRQLDKLSELNTIKKYFNEVENVYEYQYIKDIDECSHHLHLKCVSCGKLIHLHCQLSDPLVNHVKKDHKFIIDFNNTIIYGRCSKCLLIK